MSPAQKWLFILSGAMILSCSSAYGLPPGITFTQTPKSVAIDYDTLATTGYVIGLGGLDGCGLSPVSGGHVSSNGLAQDAGCAYGGLYIPPQSYLYCPIPNVTTYDGGGNIITVIYITGYCGPPGAELLAFLRSQLNSALESLTVCILAAAGDEVLIEPCVQPFAFWLGSLYEVLNDPADSNYTTIAQPTPPPFTPFSLPSLTPNQLATINAAFRNINEAAGIAQALYTSINRSQGAYAAGNSYWTTAQMAAEAQWAQQLATNAAARGFIASQLPAALIAAGLSNTIFNTDVISFQNQLAQVGFPTSILTILTQAGLTSDEIAASIQIITQLDPIQLTGTFSSVFANTFQAGSANTSQQLAAFASAVPKTTVLGDLNGDLVDNCADADIIKSSFGLHAGYPGFDARADTNLDGVVDVRDLAFVSRYLPTGTKCQ